MLALPVTLAFKALNSDCAELFPPVVFKNKATRPKAVLVEPVVFEVKAPLPKAVLLAPVVFESKAVITKSRISCNRSRTIVGQSPVDTSKGKSLPKPSDKR
jgi:hypothetical protein